MATTQPEGQAMTVRQWLTEPVEWGFEHMQPRWTGLAFWLVVFIWLAVSVGAAFIV
jgi:hypothetical protein